jgi:Co/Zn/Cd efflux system component
MTDQSPSINGSSSLYEEHVESEASPKHQRVFDSNELNHPHFDDEEGVEMVPVTVRWKRQASQQFDNIEGKRPSNERLLVIAFLSFFGFTTCQAVAAYVAGSEAMMGDSAAMFVDAMTYLFNLIAERRKSRFNEYESLYADETDPERRLKLVERARRKMILKLEVIPPVVSVTTLLCVTVVVLRGSITVLKLDAHRDESEQGDPNVQLMLLFSCLNLLLDIVNVFCFAQAKHMCGFQTSTHHLVHGPESLSIATLSQSPQKYSQIMSDDHDHSDDEHEHTGFEHEHTGVEHDEEEACMNGDHSEEQLSEADLQKRSPVEDFHDEADLASQDTEPVSNVANKHVAGTKITSGDDDDENDQEEANLNMCSAYTVRVIDWKRRSIIGLGFSQNLFSLLEQHVFADTLRSIAVIVAATIAELADSVTSEEADATAAVVVSILILLSVIPLFSGLLSTFGELHGIYAEERDEEIASKREQSRALANGDSS